MRLARNPMSQFRLTAAHWLRPFTANGRIAPLGTIARPGINRPGDMSGSEGATRPVPVRWSARRVMDSVVVVAALSVVALLTAAWWYGGDSSSNPPSQPGTRVQVYVGELGGYDTSTCDTAYFDVTSAIDVGRNNGSYDNVYSYWYLEGPEAEGVYNTAAYALGIRQASDLYACWQDEPYSDGLTLFADAEYGQGWYTGPFNCECSSTARWQSNVNVISGFVAHSRHKKVLRIRA
jgi:hypothetical protein